MARHRWATWRGHAAAYGNHLCARSGWIAAALQRAAPGCAIRPRSFHALARAKHARPPRHVATDWAECFAGDSSPRQEGASKTRRTTQRLPSCCDRDGEAHRGLEKYRNPRSPPPTACKTVVKDPRGVGARHRRSRVMGIALLTFASLADLRSGARVAVRAVLVGHRVGRVGEQGGLFGRIPATRHVVVEVVAAAHVLVGQVGSIRRSRSTVSKKIEPGPFNPFPNA